MSSLSAQLSAIATRASQCTACELHLSRTQVVMGCGPVPSDLVVVGEAPGEKEDKSGLPFVGRSGQLLVALIDEVLGRTRDSYFITNVAKCRPCRNATPTTAQARACAPHLDAEMEMARPRVIVAVGNCATQHLLQTRSGVTTLHGTRHPRHGSVVVPTFHPAYALRGGHKVVQLMKEDLTVVRDTLEQT